MRSKINFAIEKAFREAGITLPFPQQDVHLQMTPAINEVVNKLILKESLKSLT